MRALRLKKAAAAQAGAGAAPATPAAASPAPSAATPPAAAPAVPPTIESATPPMSRLARMKALREKKAALAAQAASSSSVASAPPVPQPQPPPESKTIDLDAVAAKVHVPIDYDKTRASIDAVVGQKRAPVSSAGADPVAPLPAHWQMYMHRAYEMISSRQVAATGVEPTGCVDPPPTHTHAHHAPPCLAHALAIFAGTRRVLVPLCASFTVQVGVRPRRCGPSVAAHQPQSTVAKRAGVGVDDARLHRDDCAHIAALDRDASEGRGTARAAGAETHGDGSLPRCGAGRCTVAVPVLS